MIRRPPRSTRTDTLFPSTTLFRSLKNIVAIAVGMGDGLGAGDNTRAALMTRGLAEITRLGVAMGGRAETFAGLAGMGAPIATLTSALARTPPGRLEIGLGRGHAEILPDRALGNDGRRHRREKRE